MFGFLKKKKKTDNGTNVEDGQSSTEKDSTDKTKTTIPKPSNEEIERV
jgi:hypothetical protein